MATVTTAQDFDHYIREALRARVKTVCEKEANEAVERVRKQVNAEIDRIALAVARNYSVDTMGHELIIRVNKLQEGGG